MNLIAENYVPPELIYFNGFYVDMRFNKQQRLEKIIHTDQKPLYRFIDFFFCPSPVNQLSEDQVVILCELRLKFLKNVLESELNTSITQKIIGKILENTNGKPLNILDFGCGNGHSTLCLLENLSKLKIKNNIAGFDLSTLAIENKITPELQLFVANKDPKIPFENNYFTIITAIFVMHFNITDFYLNEIYRVLDLNGLFIYNIYNSSHEDALVVRLENQGFVIKSVLRYNAKHTIYTFEKPNPFST